MRTTLRLTVKQHRFELAAVTAACFLVAAALLYAAWRLDAVGIPKDCLYGGGPVVPSDQHEQLCQSFRDRFYGVDNALAGRLFALLTPLPLLSGLLLGVPLVGRELEAGTAPLAWTLARSRTRWFLARALLMAAILAGLLLVPALAAEALEAARAPNVDPGASFSDYGLRGGLVVVHGLMAFGAGLLGGAVLGRQLPGLIAAGTLTVVMGLVTTSFVGPWSGLARSMASWQTQGSEAVAIVPGSLFFDQVARDRTTGATLPVEGAFIASATGGATFDEARFEMVSLVLPGTRYAEVASIEGSVVGGLGVLALLGSMIVVTRRRPA